MKAKWTLIFSIFFGACTTFLFYSYSNNQKTEPVIQEELVVVVVAKESIPKNMTISGSMVKEAYVSKKYVHERAIQSISEIEGLIATSEIAQGEIILSHHLQEVSNENKLISRKVQEGYRAVAIGVNFVQSVSNLIEPEDIVDVVFTMEDENGEIRSELLFSKVRVLAVDRRMVELKQGEQFSTYSSVTLELKPEAAVRIINGSEKGNIHLIVHSKLLSTIENE
jgi:pilus assembly protein CpaB